MRKAIRQVFYKKEAQIIKALNNYPQQNNFFEMMRFDFIIDDKLKIYLMEANMSPNLSSAHFKENRLLYEQVVFNILNLVGVGRSIHSTSLKSTSTDEDDMLVADKDIQVFPEHCNTNCPDMNNCFKNECQLCKICLNESITKTLKYAYLEHNRRKDCRRVIPQAIKFRDAHEASTMDSLSPQNTLMTEWFRGKCLIDKSFCQ